MVYSQRRLSNKLHDPRPGGVRRHGGRGGYDDFPGERHEPGWAWGFLIRGSYPRGTRSLSACRVHCAVEPMLVQNAKVTSRVRLDPWIRGVRVSLVEIQERGPDQKPSEYAVIDAVL